MSAAAPASLAAEKQDLRQRVSARRRALAVNADPGASARVARELLRRPEVRRARTIALYAALPDELPTRPVFEWLAAPGRVLAFPEVRGVAQLRFRAVERWEQLRPGRFGVATPPPTAPDVAVADFDLVLAPGVAFDEGGRRLGRGGGYYDATFPAGADAAPLIGLAWSFQVVERVPSGSRDRRVDAIVTERGWLPRRREWFT